MLKGNDAGSPAKRTNMVATMQLRSIAVCSLEILVLLEVNLLLI